MTRILVRRDGAFGDVLIATPITRRLRLEDPDAVIDIATSNGSVFEGSGWRNADINNVVSPDITPFGYDRVIDLNMAHERNRRIHQIDSYMEVAFGDRLGPKQIIFPSGNAPDLGVDWSKVVTIHPNTSWESRTIPGLLWERLVAMLTDAGLIVVTLGTTRDKVIPGTIDTRSKLNLLQQASAIQHSRAFVCGGSGLFMLSGATSTPTVVFLTISRAEHCLPFRNDILGDGYFPLIPDIECYGCNEEYGPVTFVGCLRKDFACVSLFTADQAFGATMKAIG